MNRIIILLLFVLCSVVSFGQTRGGMINIMEPRKKQSTIVSRSSSQGKRKSSASVMKSKSKKRGSKNSQRVTDVDKDIPEPTAEDFFQWGDEEYKKKNYSEAKEWFELAAWEGHTVAQYYLGYLYEKGEGVTKDFGQAARWYLKAIDGGEARAARHLGLLYYYGDLDKDYKTALVYLEKAAEAGDFVGTWQTAYMYEKGEGTEKDMYKARKYYNQIYEKMYEEGKKAMKSDDGELAIASFYEVSRIKDPSRTNDVIESRALTLIGFIYYYGKCGVKIDNEKAFYYFNKAAESAVNFAAECYIGKCYENGYGVAKNQTLANKYYELSRKHQYGTNDAYSEILSY